MSKKVIYRFVGLKANEPWQVGKENSPHTPKQIAALPTLAKFTGNHDLVLMKNWKYRAFASEEPTSPMPSGYYFPLRYLIPQGDWTTITSPPYHLVRRRWNTALYDLATLQTNHKMHLSFQVADILLNECNMEVMVESDNLKEAIKLLFDFQFGLYIAGASPTFSPLASNYSVNDYSGINARDHSEHGTPDLPEELRTGITSKNATVEMWPMQPNYVCRIIEERLNIDAKLFHEAVNYAKQWNTLEIQYPKLRVIREASRSAPLIEPMAQSLLHIWCALEAIILEQGSELSFRLALTLAQLQNKHEKRAMFKTIRDGYKVRSKIAHGGERETTEQQWEQAWDILLCTAHAVLQRNKLPSEEDLMRELLA